MQMLPKPLRPAEVGGLKPTCVSFCNDRISLSRGALGTGKLSVSRFSFHNTNGTVETEKFCLISWMTLSLDLVNKYSLSSSCVPSAGITHNPGTRVHHNQAGRKAEMWTLTHYQRPKEGKGKGLFMGTQEEGVVLLFPGQGRKASQRRDESTSERPGRQL